MNRLHGIGPRILVLVAAVVSAGLAGLTLFYAERQERSILAENERTMVKVADSVTQALRTVMLAGYADISREFGDHLLHVADVSDLRILRIDGTEAFRDNRTIEQVNEALGHERFRPRIAQEIVPVLPVGAGALRTAAGGEMVTYYERAADGHRDLTVLAPVTSQAACQGCHLDDRPVRGVLKLTTSLAHLDGDIHASWMRSIAAGAAALAAVLAVVWLTVQRTVVRPIHAVTAAMDRAGRGELAPAAVHGRDEIGRMAVSFNIMTAELSRMYSGLRSEQNKLSTILLGARDGIVATDGDGRVVLVNPAAEELLGKGADAIAAGGLENLLDDPDWARARLALPLGQQCPEPVRYRDRVLSAYMASIHGDDGAPIGSAALLRDVTEETRLREELERLAVTDGLTGLYNRRYFDQKLADELQAAVRYGRPLSVLLFDVDHFKRFNDTHGHDMGDKVLQALADVLRTSRTVDIPCRYGGEEFAVILPNTPQDKATAAAERLRRAVAALDIEGLEVTVSIGVAARPPHMTDSRDTLVKAADQALYAAKQAGRNRVETAPAPTPDQAAG